MPKSHNCMKPLSLFAALVIGTGIFLPSGSQGQSINYVNDNVVIGRPEIVADTFSNLGYFEIANATNVFNDPDFGSIGSTEDMPPFAPFGTTHFTNGPSGRMIGDFRFATKNETTFEPAEHFLNDGLIESFNHLLISADLIENHGVLNAGSSSRLEIRGNTVDFTFGKLNASQSEDFIFGGGAFGLTNYANPIGIRDRYWAVGTNQVLAGDGTGQGTGRVFDHSNYLIPTNFLTAPHDVVFAGTLQTNTVLLPTPFFAPDFTAADFGVSVQTNALEGTNAIIQLVYFRTNFPQAVDTNTSINAETRWVGVNDFSFPIVNYQYNSFNNFEDDFTSQDLFIFDRFQVVEGTNRFLLTNFSEPVNSRPNTYDIIRDRSTAEPVWDSAVAGNTTFTNTLLINPSLAATVVSNSVYAAYSFELTPPEPTRFIFIGGIRIPVSDPVSDSRHPTNMVGRMLIEAETLDLTASRIRAENYLKIQADKVIGSSPASVDSLRYDLTLSNDEDVLSITNLVRDTVSRFSGQVGLYTTTWTNQITQLSTNVDEAGTETITTNFADAYYHVFVVDPIFQTDQNSEIMQLTATNGKKIQIGDNFVLNENITLDAPEVELYGRITGRRGVPLIDDLAFPSLQKIGIFNTLSLVDGLRLGQNRDLTSITIGGAAAVSASSMSLKAETLELKEAATLSTSFAGISIEGNTLNLTDGSTITPLGVTIITGQDINIGGLTLDTFSSIMDDFPDVVLPLTINVGSTLHDDGIGAMITTSAGIHVNGSGLQGDLSFSTITSMIPKFRQTIHSWPAMDNGASASAFNNNLAVGTFEFNVAGAPSRVIIRGTSEGNHALYVNNLVLSGAAETSFAEVFSIPDNFRIYFQNVTSANGLLMLEDVNGAYDGKFVHVPVVADDQTAGGSGIPVSIVTETLAADGSQSVTLQVQAQPGVTYIIEQTTDLSSGIWTPVGTIINQGSTTASLSSQPFTVDTDQAFFRIRGN